MGRASMSGTPEWPLVQVLMTQCFTYFQKCAATLAPLMTSHVIRNIGTSFTVADARSPYDALYYPAQCYRHYKKPDNHYVCLLRMGIVDIPRL